MPRLRRPRRLEGVPYDVAGPVYHVAFATRGHERTLDDEVASVTLEALRFRHGRGARILAFAVMPDHVHILVTFEVDGLELTRWVGDLKRWVGREMRQRGHAVEWQSGFYEHRVRSDEDVAELTRYIMENPLRAGLVEEWNDWPWVGSLAWDA